MRVYEIQLQEELWYGLKTDFNITLLFYFGFERDETLFGHVDQVGIEVRFVLCPLADFQAPKQKVELHEAEHNLSDELIEVFACQLAGQIVPFVFQIEE